MTLYILSITTSIRQHVNFKNNIKHYDILHF